MKDLKIQDGYQFWPQIILDLKSTTISWYCLNLAKTNIFEILFVFVAYWDDNSENLVIHGLPEAIFKMLVRKMAQSQN